MATGNLKIGQVTLAETTPTIPASGELGLTKATGSDKLQFTNSSNTTTVLISANDNAIATAVESGASSNTFVTPNAIATLNHFQAKYFGTFSALYDFAIHTGAVGTYSLIRPDGTDGTAVLQIPNKAVITKAYMLVETSCTSGGSATLQFGVLSDDPDGLLTATAFSSFTAGTWIALTPDGTTANFTNFSTSQRAISLIIATAALTAGKIQIWGEYIVKK